MTGLARTVPLTHTQPALVTRGFIRLLTKAGGEGAGRIMAVQCVETGAATRFLGAILLLGVLIPTLKEVSVSVRDSVLSLSLVPEQGPRHPRAVAEVPSREYVSQIS